MCASRLVPPAVQHVARSRSVTTLDVRLPLVEERRWARFGERHCERNPDVRLYAAGDNEPRWIAVLSGASGRVLASFQP